MGASRARAVVRCPEQLRLHRALHELGWTGIDELNDASRLKKQSVPEPILITANNIILAGLGPWRLALLEGEREIPCIEYPFSDDDSLKFILSYHRSRRGWNAFVRIRLALTQEPLLRQRALDNMRTGGKYKGWANLPDVQRIDVRQQIAMAAGVGCRNVSNVKTILNLAHPQLIQALTEGALTINRAMQFCKLPRAKQLEQFTRSSTERATNKVIRRSVSRPNEKKTSSDLVTVLDALKQQEALEPGSIVVRVGRLRRTVVLVGRDLLTGIYCQKELKLHEIPPSTQADSVSNSSTLGPR